MTINVASATAQLPLLTNALEKARQRQLALGDLFNIATILSNGGHQSQAVELYKGWIAYNDGNPLLHLAYFNYAVAANVMGDRAGAINAFRACLKLDPQFGPAHINLGRVLEDSGLINPAVEQWRSYAEITSDITADRLGHRLMTLKHIGRVLEGAGRMEEAEKVLWQAMELQPEKDRRRPALDIATSAPMQVAGAGPFGACLASPVAGCRLP